jgi:hypothetical protein
LDLLEFGRIEPNDYVILGGGRTAAVAVAGQDIKHAVRADDHIPQPAELPLEVAGERRRLGGQVGLEEAFAAQGGEIERPLKIGHAGGRPGIAAALEDRANQAWGPSERL